MYVCMLIYILSDRERERETGCSSIFSESGADRFVRLLTPLGLLDRARGCAHRDR